MSDSNSDRYEPPEVTAYGNVESITQQDKIGNGDDQFSEITSLSGSII